MHVHSPLKSAYLNIDIKVNRQKRAMFNAKMATEIQ